MFILLFLIFWKVIAAYFLLYTRSEYWYLKFKKWCWYFFKSYLFFIFWVFKCWFFWISLLISRQWILFFSLWVLNVSYDRPEYIILKSNKNVFWVHYEFNVFGDFSSILLWSDDEWFIWMIYGWKIFLYQWGTQYFSNDGSDYKLL